MRREFTCIVQTCQISTIKIGKNCFNKADMLKPVQKLFSKNKKTPKTASKLIFASY